MAKSHYIDYGFKSYVLREHDDLLKRYKQSSKLHYDLCNYHENGDMSLSLCNRIKKGISIDYNPLLDLQLYCEENGLLKEYKEVKKINHASYYRMKRLRLRVSNMLCKGECLFITLTFNDEYLNISTESERRTAVTRFLKSCNGEYVANIDFGSVNHREHYHALICVNKVNVKEWHKYGAIHVQKVRNRNIETDSKRLSKYVCKLANHCIKETTRRNALIYSR